MSVSATGDHSFVAMRCASLCDAPLVGALVFALMAHGAVASAQRAPDRWRFTGDVGGVLGGTWLRGIGAPTVTTDPGASIGVGASRPIGSGSAVGALLRIGAQPVVMKESGTTWSGGTLTETDVLATLVLMSPQGTALRPALELGAGAALLSGARNVLPFHDASSVAPIVEGGVAVRRDANSSSPEDLALFVHYGLVRLDASQTNAVSTSGWVPRLIVGLRVTR
jgi:hypothetical protein